MELIEITSRTVRMTALLLGAQVSLGFFRVPALARAGSPVRSARARMLTGHTVAGAAVACFRSCLVADEVARYSMKDREGEEDENENHCVADLLCDSPSLCR